MPETRRQFPIWTKEAQLWDDNSREHPVVSDACTVDPTQVLLNFSWSRPEPSLNLLEIHTAPHLHTAHQHHLSVSYRQHVDECPFPNSGTFESSSRNETEDGHTFPHSGRLLQSSLP